jgi:hypothetical protein
MNSATATSQGHDHPPATPLVSQQRPGWRAPTWRDYLIFFGAIPAGIGFLFSLVGIRLIAGMPYFDALLYMILHMFVAWWCVSIGAGGIKYAFRQWRPPTFTVCVIGFFISIVPAAFIYQKLGDFYGNIYPSFAASRSDDALPSWEIEYLLHFVRYSIPALPLFLAGVYGYLLATGVDWFGYGPRENPIDTIADITDLDESAPELKVAVAGLIEGSKLPADASLIAIRAEQHYIQIWSDQGKDLVRYRFKDVGKLLADCSGMQVHRSWWANLAHVQSSTVAGRKLELIMADGITVPVSLAYKNAVLTKLKTLGKNID